MVTTRVRLDANGNLYTRINRLDNHGFPVPHPSVNWGLSDATESDLTEMDEFYMDAVRDTYTYWDDDDSTNELLTQVRWSRDTALDVVESPNVVENEFDEVEVEPKITITSSIQNYSDEFKYQ